MDQLREKLKAALEKPERRRQEIAIDLPGETEAMLIYCPEISAIERDRWEKHISDHKSGMPKAGIRALTVAWFAETEPGVKAFTKDDAQWLTEMPAAPAAEFFDAFCRLNRVGPQDQDELVGNSGATHNGSQNSESLLQPATATRT